MYSKDEIKYYKKDFPTAPFDESAQAGTSLGTDPEAQHYKQSMKTMLELNKKELLCMTLFVIDDDCGGHEYIRTES